MAMADCYVTCSHFPKVIKEDVKMRVQSMGGHCTDSIFQVNTHLVTDSVKSEKYLVYRSIIKINIYSYNIFILESGDERYKNNAVKMGRFSMEC